MTRPTVPTALHGAIEQAHHAMLQHPEHAVVPIQRQRIYRAIGSLEVLRVNSVRGWLAHITAQHVLPKWNRNMSIEPSAKDLLSTLEDVLRGSINVATARDTAEQAWSQLEQFGNSPQMTDDEFNVAFYATTTIVQALFETIGMCSLDDLSLSATDTDDWIDPWSSDTAKWAAIAYVGTRVEATSGSEKRREFWEWWLLEAIPAAWDKAMSQ